MKFKSGREEIKYSLHMFDIIVNEKKKKVMMSYLKNNNFIFHNKIFELIF